MAYLGICAGNVQGLSQPEICSMQNWIIKPHKMADISNKVALSVDQRCIPFGAGISFTQPSSTLLKFMQSVGLKSRGTINFTISNCIS